MVPHGVQIFLGYKLFKWGTVGNPAELSHYGLTEMIM